MAGSIRYKNDFIVFGDANAVLTENFRVNEFLNSDGNIRVHRELLAGLQIMRDRIDSGIRITGLKPPASMGRDMVENQ